MKTCLTCHFLKKYNQYIDNVVSTTDREKIKQNDYSWSKNCNIACEYGVWDCSGKTEEIIEKEIKTINRDKFCFYWPYHESMPWPAAKILQKREERNKELKNQKLFTNFNLLIAALAFLASATSTYHAINLSKKQEARLVQSDFNKLKSTVDEILALFPANPGKTIVSYTVSKQVVFFETIKSLLDSQNDNYLLADNSTALTYWRQATGSVKNYRRFIYPEIPTNKENKDKNLEILVNSLFQDIFTVYQELTKIKKDL